MQEERGSDLLGLDLLRGPVSSSDSDEGPAEGPAQGEREEHLAGEECVCAPNPVPDISDEYISQYQVREIRLFSVATARHLVK